MKNRIVFLIALVLVLTAATGLFAAYAGDSKELASVNDEAVPVFEKVSYASGVVNASFLNMRQGPSTDYTVSKVLKKGQTVNIIGKMGSWYAAIDADSGIIGCLHSSYITMPASVDLTSEKLPDPDRKEEEKETDKGAVLDVSENEKVLLDLINESRIEAGLKPLEFDPILLRVARLKAQDMVDNNYFSHQSNDFGSPWDMMRKYDIAFATAGENIAGNKTIEGAFNAWINSEAHKKNILNDKFSHTGIGIVESPAYGKILVQQFIGK